MTWNEELTVALGIFSGTFEGDHDFIYSQALAAIPVLNPVFTITFVPFSEENDWEVQTMFTFWCFQFQNTSAGQKSSCWSFQTTSAVNWEEIW